MEEILGSSDGASVTVDSAARSRSKRNKKRQQQSNTTQGQTSSARDNTLDCQSKDINKVSINKVPNQHALQNQPRHNEDKISQNESNSSTPTGVDISLAANKTQQKMTPPPMKKHCVETKTTNDCQDSLRIINPEYLGINVIPQLLPTTPGSILVNGISSPLHSAVQNLNVSQLVQLLKTKCGINEREHGGFTPLIRACVVSDHNVSLKMCQLLLESGADCRMKDQEGFTAAHWAACRNHCDVLELLAKHKCRFTAQTKYGETPLHRASRTGSIDAVAFLLKFNPRLVLLRNTIGHSPLDVAGEHEINSFEDQHNNREAIRKLMFQLSPSLRTLILYHEDCDEHITTDSHQEAPERIQAILQKLRESFPADCLEFSNAFPPASPNQLRKAHSAEYVNFVLKLHNQVKSLGSPVAFTPRVQRAVSKTQNVKDDSGCDTFFSKGSLPAAIRAAGSVCHAVNQVVQQQFRNAFCVVRPPGHHAGVRGLLHNSTSCGFCIFNNVAIGASHALSQYPEKIKRVAIIDFDVHHGNGTEEVVRSRINRPSQVFFFSIHLFDNEPSDPTYEFYPGTGNRDVLHDNVVNAPVAPLWRKLRTSARGRSNSAGTSQSNMSQSISETRSDENDAGENSDSSLKYKYSSGPRGNPHVCLEDESEVNGGIYSGFHPTAKYGRLAYRAKLMAKLLPALRAFNPDLILISAGFDAGHNDVGCSKTLKGQFSSGADLDHEDYEWITERIQDVARVCCDGRVISVLEGGYGTWKRVKDDNGKVSLTLDRSNLADNAAGHVKGLWDGNKWK